MSHDKYYQRLESLFSNTERVPPDPNPPATSPEAPAAEAMPARPAELEASVAEASPAPLDEQRHPEDQAQMAAGPMADQLTTVSMPSDPAHEGVAATSTSEPEVTAADQAAGRDRPGLLRIGRWSVRVKLAAMVLLGMVGIALALGWLMFSTANSLFAEQAESTLRRQNEIVADQIEDLTDKASGELLLARQNPEFNRYFLATDESSRQAAFASIQSLMLYLQDRFAIDEICWIRANGVEIARCVQGTLAGVDELSPDESGSPFFRPTMALDDGEVYSSPVPYISADTQRWVVAFATPLVLPDGRKVGIFHFEIPLEWFAAKVETNALKGGYSFLMTKDGRLLVHPQLDQFRQAAGIDASNPDQADFPLATISGSQEFQRLVEQMKADGLGQGTYREGGEAYEVVYQPVLGGQWIVATVLPQSVIYRSTFDLLRRTLTIAAPLLAAALGLMLWYSGALVRPLHTTSRALRALAAEGANLNQRVPVATRDEFGELAQAFNHMVEKLQDSQQRVGDRMRDVALAAEIAQRVSAMHDLNALLAEAVETIRARFDLYYTQIYLTNPDGTALALRAGTGTVGQELLRRSHRLPVGSGSINGTAAAEKRPVLVSDTAASGLFRPNPLLPGTRSEVSMPLVAGERVVGVLDLQSVQPGAFTGDNLSVFEALAGQLAVAIENARLFADAAQAHAEVEAQARRLTRDHWQAFLNAVDRSEHLGYAYDQVNLTPLAEPLHAPDDGALAVPIVVTGEPVGTLQLEIEASRVWTEAETELVQSVARQVSQQVENLRLLTEAERARAEAEQATRRLTREGWQDYLEQAAASTPGYVYDLDQVAPLASDSTPVVNPALARPLLVQAETIGVLEVEVAPGGMSDEAAELVAEISERLSAHIENLRLAGQTERALTQTEQQAAELRALFAAMPDVVLVYDEQGRYVKIAPTNPSLLYKPPEDMLGKTLAEVLPAPQAEAFLGYIRQVLDTRETLNVEYALPIGGQEIWFSATLSPLTANTVFWIARDITERKQAEAVLAKRATELQTVARVSTAASTVLEARILLQNVVDLTKESFDLYHAHLYLIDEPTGMLVLAAGAGEVGRRMVSEGRSIPLNRAQSLVARAAREREAVVVNDVRAVPDFLPHPLLPDTRSEMAIPMIVGDQLLGVFDVQHDQPDYFTEEDVRIQTTLAAQVAVALQNANLYAEQAATVTRLRELDHLKSTFLANMSHELRTPLNSILGFTDVMLEGLDGPLTDLMESDLKVVQKNGKHLLNLINDVLDMAKIEAGKMSLSLERFNLQEVLEEVVELTGPLARDKALDLQIAAGLGEELALTADRVRLRQVMINLVGNAIKFTEQGGVTLQAVRENGSVRIAIRDTGLGVPPEKLEAIFEAFNQVDTSTTRKAGGTGLGLPISRRLIELHGGRLWAESAGLPGEGSTFFVELPVQVETPDVVV